MGLQPSFDVLSQLIEQYESNGRSVRNVAATSGEDGTLHVTMDIPVALCSSGGGVHPEFIPETATLTEEGGLEVAFSASVLDRLPATIASSVSASNQAVRVTDNGGLLLTVEFTIAPPDDEIPSATTHNQRSDTAPSVADEGSSPANSDRSTTTNQIDEPSSHSEPPTDLTAVRDESLPLYKDTEYLKRLYESYDTFSEMNQKIEIDVASETVRRYMIEAGIHTPTSYNVATDEEQADERLSTADGTGTETETVPTTPETPQSPSETDDSMETVSDELLVTDGIGLPENLQIEDVVDAVVDSVTVYEVQQHLDLERQRTQQLLEQLNLLNLVMRRMTDNPEQAATYEEVVSRIRQCSPPGA